MAERKVSPARALGNCVRSSAALRTHNRDWAMRVVEHGVAYRTQQ
jgi:hypothetical protein